MVTCHEKHQARLVLSAISRASQRDFATSITAAGASLEIRRPRFGRTIGVSVRAMRLTNFGDGLRAVKVGALWRGMIFGHSLPTLGKGQTASDCGGTTVQNRGGLITFIGRCRLWAANTRPRTRKGGGFTSASGAQTIACGRRETIFEVTTGLAWSSSIPWLRRRAASAPSVGALAHYA